MIPLNSLSYKALLFSLVAMMIVAPLAGLIVAPLFILAAIGPFILWVRDRKFIELCQTPGTKWGMVVISLALLSSLWSIEFSRTVYYAGQLIVLFFAAVSLYYYVSSLSLDVIKKLERVVVTSFLIGTFLWCVEIITGGLLVSWGRALLGDYDYEFSLDDLNRGSTFLVLSFWFLVSFVGYRYRPFIIMILAVLLVFVLSFSASLAALLAMCVATIMFVWACWFPSVRFMSGVAMTLAMVMVIIVLGFLIDIFPFVADVDRLPSSIRHRFVIWDFVARNIMEQPIEGVGYHNARFVAIEAKDWVAGFNPLPIHPHNIVLQVWLELGCIGLVCLAGVLWQLLRAVESRMGNVVFIQQAAMYGWYAAFLIIASVAYEAWQPWWLSSIAITFILGSVLAAKQHQTS